MFLYQRRVAQIAREGVDELERGAPIGEIAQGIEQLDGDGLLDGSAGVVALAQGQGASPAFPFLGRSSRDDFRLEPGKLFQAIFEGGRARAIVFGELGKNLIERGGSGRLVADGGLDDLGDLGGGRVGYGFGGKRVTDLAHLIHVEQRQRPVGGRHDAALLFSRVPNSHLVVDIAVGNGDVGQDEVGNGEAFDHFGDDQRAHILVRAHRFVASLVDGWTERGFPKAVEVDFVWSCGALSGAGRFGAVGHDHEADGTWHGGFLLLPVYRLRYALRHDGSACKSLENPIASGVRQRGGGTAASQGTDGGIVPAVRQVRFR